MLIDFFYTLRSAKLPVSVKDLFDVAGQPTPAGSTVLANAQPAVHDARAVARLRAAGIWVTVGVGAEQALFDLGINNRRFFTVDHRHLLGDDVVRDHLVVLRQQNGIGQAYVACACDSNFHLLFAEE